MIRPTVAGLLLLLVTFSAQAQSVVAFVNVNVVPMDGPHVLEGQTVIVESGRIAVTGAVDSTPVPEVARIVDGTDRFLIPGLAEMHAHVPPEGSASLERTLTLFAANGVTLIRGMLGHPSHLALRDALETGERFGPRLVTSGPSLNGNSVASPEDGVSKVRAQHAAGYDFLKIHPGLSAAEFRAIAAAANELDMPFAGHVPASVGLSVALEAGMATIDHLDGYFGAMMPADTDPSGGFGGFFGVLLADAVVEDRIVDVAQQTAAAGTWNVPTEALIEHRIGPVSAAELSARPEMRMMPRSTVAQWEQARLQIENDQSYRPELGARAIELRQKLIKALHDAGAGLLLGSDAPQVYNVPGHSAHHELAFLVAAGLTPYEALRTGTAAVGEFLGDDSGVIAPGRPANLVLLDANPLDDIANIRRVHGVMLGGRWHSRNMLQSRLDRFRTVDE